MIFILFRYIDIYTTVTLISITIGKDFLYQLFLFNDMTSSMRFNRRWKHVERLHSIMIAICVILRNLHWFKLFKTSFLLNLVIALISIMLKMTYISDIANISHLIALMFKIAEQYVESYRRTCMSKMRVTINSRSADIHTNIRSSQRFEQLFMSRK